MSSKPKRRAGEVAPEVAKQIDENLKHLYMKDVEEELPASLMQLLDALRAKDAAGKPGEK
ncbi:MAG: NepR family anti-sigma factor [Roseinatronobacter sp.]